jgi:hypothetical protein
MIDPDNPLLFLGALLGFGLAAGIAGRKFALRRSASR